MKSPAATDSVNFQFAPCEGAQMRDSSVAIAFIPSEVIDSNTGIDTALFMGFGNNGPLPRLAIEKLADLNCAPGVVAIEGLPYEHTVPSEIGIKRFTLAATEALSDFFRESLGANTLNAIAQSQAGPGLAWTARELPDHFDRKLAFEHTLGVTHISKGQFIGRMLLTGIQRDQIFARSTNVIAINSINKLYEDLRFSRLSKMNIALNTDITQSLGDLAGSGRDIRLFWSERDRLFPAHDVQATLDAISHDVFDLRTISEVMIGSHSSPASKAGAKQIAHILAWCRQKQVHLDNYQID